MEIVSRELVVRRGQLVIPKEFLNKITGNKRRRISIAITDPRSRHVILTRYPENYKVWYETTIPRDTDFIPTAVLVMAKIENDEVFSVAVSNGDLIVRRMKQ